MGILDDLNIPVYDPRVRNATPKHAMKSRMVEKAEADKADDSAEETWRKAVRKRDGMKCRWCRRRVVVCVDMRPEQAECHHATPREHRPTRWDVRNGILVCRADHERLTGKVGGEKAVIVASAVFLLNGREYPNMAKPVHFKVLAK
jgi:hypothetical protein